jgi:hypothetical protein
MGGECYSSLKAQPGRAGTKNAFKNIPNGLKNDQQIKIL